MKFETDVNDFNRENDALTREKARISKTYPISEVFTSPQGEGMYAGQMQTFIRLAGCTVGKRYPKEMYGTGKHLLPVYTERCTLSDSRTFACDTDYRVKAKMTAEELMQQVPVGVDDVCITGGEPLMHDLSTLITYLFGIGRKIHIETSGTIYVNLKPDIWVTVSPKYGVLGSMIDRANELKILVDKDFNPERTIEFNLLNLAYKKPVYLQPVNGEKDICPENLRLCLEWQRKFPQFRISCQLHKIISHYIQEEVR